ncbi:DUF1707 domain-containing protein [Streptosporangium sp. NPDC001559]|uniref:DUF1707 SHOCT-like domain-containing protein n=1 Tax=Streptosporangium sp. NPDC001559 TaxID=3366187 RepID=UPI0036DFD857
MTSPEPTSRFAPLSPVSRDPGLNGANGAGRALRASDADRDQVATVLAEALASGRLTSVEHADRLEATYSAVTVGELAPIIHDLPEVTAPSGGLSAQNQEVSAVFSKVVRSGRWIAGRHTKLSSTFGALIVDLSDAVLPGREITLEVTSLFGKLIVRVPENAHVIDEVSALFAKRGISGGVGSDNGPVIRVTGKATFGKIIVSRERSDWNLPDRP